MCQSLLKRSRHTSVSSFISFICLFHPLIFTSASFTIAPLLRGALTSVVRLLGPKAMIREWGEREREREMDGGNECCWKCGWVGRGWACLQCAQARRSQWPTSQPQNCAYTHVLLWSPTSLAESTLISSTPTGPVISQTVDSKKWIKNTF